MNIYFKNYHRFSGFIKFWSSERNKENTMQHLHFNEKSVNSEENTSDNEDFCSTILQLFQFDSEEEKKCGNEAFVCCQCFLRSSCSEILFKKGVLQNFANLTEKHVCIKKRLQHRCFSAKFANFLRTSFFTEYLRWLLLKLNMYVLQLWIYTY